MCFLAFVCHSAQWRAAVIGIGNALASLSLILLTLGYKVGKTIFLDGTIYFRGHVHMTSAKFLGF